MKGPEQSGPFFVAHQMLKNGQLAGPACQPARALRLSIRQRIRLWFNQSAHETLTRASTSQWLTTLV
jgi:hypothetical protein